MLSFLMLSAAVHGVTKNNHTRLTPVQRVIPN